MQIAELFRLRYYFVEVWTPCESEWSFERRRLPAYREQAATSARNMLPSIHCVETLVCSFLVHAEEDLFCIKATQFGASAWVEPLADIDTTSCAGELWESALKSF